MLFLHHLSNLVNRVLPLVLLLLLLLLLHMKQEDHFQFTSLTSSTLFIGPDLLHGSL